MSTIPTPGNTIIARKGAGADQGPQPRLQFNDGANITTTVVNDAANNEIDITIASAAGGGTAWLNQYYPCSDPDNSTGTYATMLMPDLIETTIRQNFMIPTALVTITRAVYLIIPKASGNLYWSTATNFAAVCSNEDFQTHTDSIALNATAVNQNEVECIDFSAALTNATGDDVVGIEFVRDASNVLDTIGADVHFLGILIQGATE